MPRRQIGIRRHVVLTQQQVDRYDKLAAKTGINFSEHVRRASDTYFQKIIDDLQKVAKK